MQKIVFDIERCALDIAKHCNSGKPWSILLDPVLFSNMEDAGFIEVDATNQHILNGRYKAFKADTLSGWYLLVNNDTIKPTNLSRN